MQQCACPVWVGLRALPHQATMQYVAVHDVMLSMYLALSIPPLHMQVSCKRQTEEAASKAAMAEAALSVARDEARAAAGKVEALTAQLAAAEDAIKVGRRGG